MKRLGWLLILLVLTGCAGAASGIERGMALRSRLLQADGCSFDAEVTADYGDKLYMFSLTCEADASGTIAFTVTEPESIAGITGTVGKEGGRLTFEDTALQFDLMADDQISPVSAPWVFLKTLRSGYLTSACEEDGFLRLTVDDSYEDDALQLDIWLEDGDIPIRAEMLYDDRRIVSMDVKSFQLR